MAKKRRTRADKIRAAQRRQHQRRERRKPAAPSRSRPRPDSSRQPVTSDTTARQPTRRVPAGLKLSLSLLVVLVSAQLLVWIWFQVSDVDTAIYEWLTL